MDTSSVINAIRIGGTIAASAYNEESCFTFLPLSLLVLLGFKNLDSVFKFSRSVMEMTGKFALYNTHHYHFKIHRTLM